MGRAVPIIRLHGNIIAPIQIELTDGIVQELERDIAEEIRRKPASGLVIEVSGVDIFDSYIARSVRDIAQMSRLMGVRTILSGLDPGMAITLVEMGMLMDGVETTLDLEGAVERLGRARREHADDEDELLALVLAEDDEPGDAGGGELEEGGG